MATSAEKNGEIRCSVEETNRVRAMLGLRPLDLGTSGVENVGVGQGGGTRYLPTSVKANVHESNGEIRCSIEETNRVRAALNLKPLIIDDNKAVDLKEEHRSNSCDDILSARQEEEAAALAQRVERSRKRRKLTERLAGGTLGDETERDNGSATDWIARSRTKIDRLIQEEDKLKVLHDRLKQRELSMQSKYSATDLAGTRVSHGINTLRQGDVLTLKDSFIIDEETGELAEDVDELENARVVAVTLEADAMRRKQKMAKGPKSARSGGNSSNGLMLDDDDGDDNDAQGKILEKYDTVLEEEGLAKRKPRITATIVGSGGVLATGDGNTRNLRQDNNADSTSAGHNDISKPRVTLDSLLGDRLKQSAQGLEATRANLEQAQDFYTSEEFETLDLAKQNKKEKKAKKQRKEKKEKKHKRDKFIASSGGGDNDDDDDDESTAIIKDKKTRKKKTKSKRVEHDADLSGGELRMQAALLAAAHIGAKTSDTIASVTEALRTSTAIKDEPQENEDVVEFSDTTGFASMIQSHVEQREQRSFQENEKKHLNPSLISCNSSKSNNNNNLSNTKNIIEKPTDSVSKPRKRERDLLNIDEQADGVDNSVANVIKYLSRRGDLKPQTDGPAEQIVGRAKDAKPDLDTGNGGFVLEYRDEQGRLLTRNEAFRQQAYVFHGHEQRPGLKKQAKRLRELERQKQREN